MAVVILAAAGLLHALRLLLLPFVLAGGVAIALDPLVNRMERRAQFPRWVIAVVLLLTILAATAAAAWWGFDKAQPVVERVLAHPAQELHAFVARSFGGESATVFGRQINAQQLSDWVLARLQQRIGGAPAATMGRLLAGAAFGIVLFFVLLFYFLAQGPELARAAIKLAPPEHRPRLGRLAEDAYPLLQRYFCGIFIVVAFTSFATWVCIGPVFHLPCAAALAVITGVLEIVPVIGPTISMTLLSIVAVARGGSPWSLAGFGVFCFGLRFGIDQIVGPVVLGRAVKLPPVVVIFAFLAGGALLGALGVLIAIPTVAVAKLALDDYYEQSNEG
jgi:predicted PurR-regulated permease PerM